MNKYETLFIINSTLEEETVNSTVEKIKSLIETSAKLENVDEWGKRRLAYPVKDYDEGYYVLMNFEAESDFPSELERVLKITEEVLKYLIIKKS